MASLDSLASLVSTQSQTLSEQVTLRGTYGRDDQSDIAAFGNLAIEGDIYAKQLQVIGSLRFATISEGPRRIV